MIPKSSKNIIIKEKYRLMSLINKDVKILKKILANQNPAKDKKG